MLIHCANININHNFAQIYGNPSESDKVISSQTNLITFEK